MFEKNNIDNDLTRPFSVKDTEIPHSPVIPPKRKRATPRVGTGKGSPLKPRKVHVSKRQQRVRAKRGFDLSGLASEVEVESQLRTPNQPSTSTAVEERSTSSSSSPAQTPPPARKTSPSPPMQRTPSPTQSLQSTPTATAVQVLIGSDGPLRLQVRTESHARGGVQRFQLLAAMSQDGDTSSTQSNFSDQPSDDELGLFAREIEHWNRVDARVEYALRDTWYEMTNTITPDPDDSKFLKTLVAVHNMSNAVANSMAHLKGYLVQLCQQRESSGKEIEIIREEIYENLQRAEYSEYISLLKRCGCQECVEVTEFDDAYNRYDEFHFLPALTRPVPIVL